MIGPLPSDISYERMLERGSEALRSAIEAARAGRDPETRAKLMWGMGPSSMARDPESRSSKSSAYFATVYAEKRERAETQRTMRDPCFHCGTRADIGCEHIRHLTGLAA